MKQIFKMFAMMVAICLAVVLPTGMALASAGGKGGGANKSCGQYCANPSDTASQNKNHQDGSVGNADNKNPKGQSPNGSDHNNGYECDGNKGIGNGNPAHTVNCPPAPSPTKSVKPSDSPKPSPSKSVKPSDSPKPSPSPKNHKITICHWANHKYVVITVDENGLNGHGKHADDIIPMPANGCPTNSPSPSPSVSPTVSPKPSPSVTKTPSPTPTIIVCAILKECTPPSESPKPKPSVTPPVVCVNLKVCTPPTQGPKPPRKHKHHVVVPPTFPPNCGGTPVKHNTVPVTPNKSATPTANTLPRTGVNTSLFLAMGLLTVGFGILFITVPGFLTNRKYL